MHPLLPQGRFTIAAKHHITIAEIYEAELVDIEKVRGKRHRERWIVAGKCFGKQGGRFHRTQPGLG